MKKKDFFFIYFTEKKSFYRPIKFALCFYQMNLISETGGAKLQTQQRRKDTIKQNCSYQDKTLYVLTAI